MHFLHFNLSRGFRAVCSSGKRANDPARISPQNHQQNAPKYWGKETVEVSKPTSMIVNATEIADRTCPEQ